MANAVAITCTFGFGPKRFRYSSHKHRQKYLIFNRPANLLDREPASSVVPLYCSCFSYNTRAHTYTCTPNNFIPASSDTVAFLFHHIHSHTIEKTTRRQKQKKNMNAYHQWSPLESIPLWYCCYKNLNCLTMGTQSSLSVFLLFISFETIQPSIQYFVNDFMKREKKNHRVIHIHRDAIQLYAGINTNQINILHTFVRYTHRDHTDTPHSINVFFNFLSIFGFFLSYFIISFISVFEYMRAYYNNKTRTRTQSIRAPYNQIWGTTASIDELNFFFGVERSAREISQLRETVRERQKKNQNLCT